MSISDNKSPQRWADLPLQSTICSFAQHTKLDANASRIALPLLVFSTLSIFTSEAFFPNDRWLELMGAVTL